MHPHPAARTGNPLIWPLLGLLLLFSLGCASVGRLVVAPTPTPFPTLLPTLLPTATLTPTPTLTPTSTLTPTPTSTLTPTSEATPFALETPWEEEADPAMQTQARVIRPSVNVRAGPSTRFPRIGEALEGETFDVLSTNPEGDWWEICCLADDQTGWLRDDLVEILGPLDEIVISYIDTPTPVSAPAPEPTPTPAPTSTPPPLFYRGEGPIFMPTNNPWVTLWIKVYRESGIDDTPLPGWRLQVRRAGVAIATSDPSGNVFQYSAPPGFGNRQLYNIKLELPDPGIADLAVYLIDSGGGIQSPIVEFTTQPGNQRREVFIGFQSAQ